MRIWRAISKYFTKNKKQLILINISSLLIIIVAIYLSITFISKAKEKETDSGTKAGVTEMNTDIVQAANMEEELTSDEDNTSSEPTATPIITPVTEADHSEVADASVEVTDKNKIEDEGDPQTEGTTGAKVKIKDQIAKKHNSEKITYGIDVAKWQGVIDWEKVKEAGVEFAMIRIGYRTQVDGTIMEDPYAKYNLQQAKANKIKIGVYFFSTAVNEKEAKEEAKWVAKFIAPYPITYPVVYNCEGFNDVNNRQYNMTISERTKVAVTFLDYMKDKGYTPMFYAAKNELDKNAQWDADTLSSKYKIWVAQYPEEYNIKNAKSSYTGKHDMWQYTSKGVVPGIEKSVDLNIAYFGYKKTAKPKDNTPQETVSADPTALINFKEVNETVTAKIQTNLRKVPSTADSKTIVTILQNGDTALRTGIGDNGWSRLEYEGQTLYAVTSYLTTDLDRRPTQAPEKKGPVYKEVNEEITAKDKTNLRSVPNTDSEDTVVEVLKYGDIATRTGIGDNGWSRVEYNGKTLYAKTSYLTTDLKYQESKKPTVDNPEEGITFTKVNEKVTAKEVTNLRLVPSSESDDTIVVALKNGEEAVRTGIGNNGWSRVEYNGQTLYAITNYLKVLED